MAGTDAAKELIWLRLMLKVPGHPVNTPIKLFGDNEGCLSLAKSPEFHQLTKHIHMRETMWKNMNENGESWNQH